MKWRQIKLAMKLRKRKSMEFEVVLSREYFSLLD